MKYYEDKSDRKMELKLLSLSEDDKLIRECMEQASAFYGCLGKMGVTEILCDRKKAQELGADCQITGIFTGGELTAFACAFEYTGLKRNGRKWLNPGDKEWRQIETLGTNVVVIPLLVGKEKVGRLIERLREQYRDSHLLFRISGEQSEKFQEDLAVVSEKNLKSHRYDAAGENVWLFHFAPQIRMEDTYFEEEILLILPGQEVLLEMGIEEAEVTMVKLTGYEIVRSEKGSAFFRKPGAACEGVLLQCDYEQLLRYQRFINLTNYEEHFEQTDRGKALIYSEKYQSDSSLLWNDLLREMVKTRKAEWSIVPDSYIMYPVTYKEQDRLLECACYDNQEIGNYMHYMDIRLQCETGVPFGKDGIDLMERYKNRLERIPLGRLRVRITLEMILDILDHEDQPVGCDAEAEAVLSIDRLSHIGVLTLVSLSTPFLLSHFLDNIVRNQLMVIEENGEAVNLYAYMQEKWGLNASGTPKSYEMIPKEKNCLNKKQLGAVLLSETIYEEGEDFGEFTDAEILKLTNSETGMGQYSRAFVVAHTNVLLDFEKDLRGTIQARMYNAAFTCFYVELLMFEEAALTTFVKSTPVKDTSLKGQVAVFADESPIVAGNYTLDVSGADSIQIYYEPDVKFEAGLYKGDTKMEEGTIEGGAYTVKVGFVDQLSGKYIKSSKLLGEPKYTVSINGETQELTGKDGASQSIDVEVDGESLELTADVNYLKDYTDSASYTFKVCTLDINVDAFKSANLKTLEDGANQITVEATRNDQPLTKEQWDAATLDVVSVNKDGEEFGIQWDVQKGSEVSTWIVTPKYKKGGMFATETGQADVTINVSAEIDGDGYGKAETVSVNIKDDKNIVDYLKRYWKHIVISLLLLILILGYVPPFKKRFARSIKKRPSIECSAEKIGLRDNVMKGNFEKDLASRLLPYVPETGRLTFSPTPVKKTAKVRASGGGSMLILNTSAFAGKEEITFNGMSIQENEKGHHRISASTIIVVSTPEFTYTCIPNVQRTANGEIKRGKRK